MAPEQVRSAANVDLRADIWAFGIVAFECLTGTPPFTGDTLLELFQKIESGQHPAADKIEPTVPAGFQAWFDVACAPDPAKRFPDVNRAWKKLLIALDCGTMDIEPSIKLGRPPPSGRDRHVLAVPQDAADGNAVTLDAAAKKGVEPRHDRSKRKTFDGAPADGGVPRATASEPQAMAHTIADEDRAIPVIDSTVETTVRRLRPRKTPNRWGAVFVAVPLLAMAAIVVWRVSSYSAGGDARPRHGGRARGRARVEGGSGRERGSEPVARCARRHRGAGGCGDRLGDAAASHCIQSIRQSERAAPAPARRRVRFIGAEPIRSRALRLAARNTDRCSGGDRVGPGKLSLSLRMGSRPKNLGPDPTLRGRDLTLRGRDPKIWVPTLHCEVATFDRWVATLHCEVATRKSGSRPYIARSRPSIVGSNRPCVALVPAAPALHRVRERDQRLLRVAEDHHRVRQEEELVLHAAEAGVHAPLEDDDRLRDCSTLKTGIP